MAQFGTLTDLPELLQAIRIQLVAGTGVPKHLVFPTLMDPTKVENTPPGKAFITIRPARFVGIPSIVAGMGRNARAYDGRIEVAVYWKLQTDAWLRDADWLTKDPGPLGLWMKVLGALEQFAPTRVSDSNLVLVIEPMRNDPGFTIPAREPVPGWQRTESVWEIKFNYRLS